MVKTVGTKAEFDAIIKNNKAVVVDFYADWCGPCKMIAPKIEALEKLQKYSDVTFIKVNVDHNSETSEECGISAMPTFQFYKDGQKVTEVVGASEEKVKAAIEKIIA